MKKYEYVFPIWLLLWLTPFIALLAWFSIKEAPHFKGAFSIAFIHFSPEVSYYIFWGMALFLVGLVFYLVFIMIQSFQLEKRFITIYENRICLPKSPISNTILNIPFRNINQVKIHYFKDVRQMIIFTEHAGKIVFSDKHVKSKADFDEIYAILQEKINTSQ